MGNICSCFKDYNQSSLSHRQLQDKGKYNNAVSDKSSRTTKSAVKLTVTDVIQRVKTEGNLHNTGKGEEDDELLKAQQNLKLSRQKFEDTYTLSKKIGQGGYSIVRRCIENKSGIVYAVKIMDLPYEGQVVDSNASSREDIFKEIEIIADLEHPNIVYLKEFFVESNKVYLVMEFLQGGELLDAVLNMGMYTESDAKIIFKQILKPIEYLHKYNITHRDLKLENFLLVNKGDICHIKLADFGLAKLLKWGNMDTVCGTPNYVAPEVITFKSNTQYSPLVDVWSAGVIMYILLSGEPPFRDENETLIFRKIRKYSYSMEHSVWHGISEEAKDLIRHLLCPVEERFSASQALNHPWLKDTNILESIDQITKTQKVNLSFRFKQDDVKQWQAKDLQMQEQLQKQMVQRSQTERNISNPFTKDPTNGAVESPHSSPKASLYQANGRRVSIDVADYQQILKANNRVQQSQNQQSKSDQGYTQLGQDKAKQAQEIQGRGDKSNSNLDNKYKNNTNNAQRQDQSKHDNQQLDNIGEVQELECETSEGTDIQNGHNPRLNKQMNGSRILNEEQKTHQLQKQQLQEAQQQYAKIQQKQQYQDSEQQKFKSAKDLQNTSSVTPNNIQIIQKSQPDLNHNPNNQIYNQKNSQNINQQQQNGALTQTKRYSRIILRMWKKSFYKIITAQGLQHIFQQKIQYSKTKRAKQ